MRVGNSERHGLLAPRLTAKRLVSLLASVICLWATTAAGADAATGYKKCGQLVTQGYAAWGLVEVRRTKCGTGKKVGASLERLMMKRGSFLRASVYEYKCRRTQSGGAEGGGDGSEVFLCRAGTRRVRVLFVF